jgi:hypothetical protein
VILFAGNAWAEHTRRRQFTTYLTHQRGICTKWGAHLPKWVTSRCAAASIRSPQLERIENATFDLDLYRAAKLLIDQHGADAPLRAAERADQILDAGGMIGATTWRRILSAIEELGRGRRDGEAVN